MFVTRWRTSTQVARMAFAGERYFTTSRLGISRSPYNTITAAPNRSSSHCMIATRFQTVSRRCYSNQHELPTLEDYPSEELLDLYGPLAHHESLALDSLKRVKIRSDDNFNHLASSILETTFDGVLPSYRFGDRSPTRYLQLGMQQVYFCPILYPFQILPDGTDNRFVPGPPSIWKYRLWAGGSVTYHKQSPHRLGNIAAVQLETVQDIRIVGKDKPEKIFVKIRKVIDTVDGGMTREECFENLALTSTPALEEIYTLCFLREPPRQGSSPRRIRRSADSSISLDMTPTNHLLFQFSALTNNAHAIHFDPSFARNDYGLKDCVVHGPLTQVLMIQGLLRQLSRYESEMASGKCLVPMHFEYTNLQPLYVNEAMAICCTPVGGDRDVLAKPWLAEKWHLWIETGLGPASSVAVKGTVRVKQIDKEAGS